MNSFFIKTPFGSYLLTTDGIHVTTLDCVKKRNDMQFDKNNKETNITSPILKKATNELNEYFIRKRNKFTIPIKLKGTRFQQSVWREIQNIPYGKTASYKEIAYNIGLPKAVRAVANAVGKNPIPIIVPCHRVIQHNGYLGGYANGIKIKKLLHNLENIKITQVRR